MNEVHAIYTPHYRRIIQHKVYKSRQDKSRPAFTADNSICWHKKRAFFPAGVYSNWFWFCRNSFAFLIGVYLGKNVIPDEFCLLFFHFMVCVPQGLFVFWALSQRESAQSWCWQFLWKDSADSLYHALLVLLTRPLEMCFTECRQKAPWSWGRREDALAQLGPIVIPATLQVPVKDSHKQGNRDPSPLQALK